MLIKVCGMKYSENIKELMNTGIDMIGFIFYKKSERYVTKIPVDIPERIKKVGVFVKESINNLIKTAEINSLDYIQLHGDEDISSCLKVKEAGFKLIKVFRVNEQFDFKETIAFEKLSDLFLFDTKAKEYGGTGKKFDWAALNNYKGNVPFLLSGGISSVDVTELRNLKHSKFRGIDLNSKFEIKPGHKDIESLRSFIKTVKTI